MMSGTSAAAIATRGSANERPATGTRAKGSTPAMTNGAIRQATFSPSKNLPGSRSSPIARDQLRSLGRPVTAADRWLTLDVLVSKSPFEPIWEVPDAAFPWELSDRRGRAAAQKDLYSVAVTLWTFVLLPDEGFALSPIGRHLVPDGRAGDQQEAVEALAELAGHEWAEVHAIPHSR